MIALISRPHTWDAHAHIQTQERLTASQGGAKEFLEGGKLANAQGAVADMMKVAAATSDPIESFFGIHDNVASKLSKNTSFHVTSVVSTWVHNDSSAFLKSLSPSQRVCLLRAAIRNANRLKRETAAAISQAAKDKLKRMEKDAEATHESEKRLIHELLCLRREILIKNADQFDAFRKSVSDSDREVLKEMKKQIRMLIKVCV